MAIPQFIIRLNCPTSTSKQAEIAEKFADKDGLMVVFNNDGFWGSQSWISNYSSEDEYIWCDGFIPIRVESIRRMADNMNYSDFCKALGYFDCILGGNQMHPNSVGKISREDHKIISVDSSSVVQC